MRDSGGLPLGLQLQETRNGIRVLLPLTCHPSSARDHPPSKTWDAKLVRQEHLETSHPSWVEGLALRYDLARVWKILIQVKVKYLSESAPASSVREAEV